MSDGTKTDTGGTTPIVKVNKDAIEVTGSEFKKFKNIPVLATSITQARLIKVKKKNKDDCKEIIVYTFNDGFKDWISKVTPTEFAIFWNNQVARDKIEDRLRSPGGWHEWLMICETPTFVKWGDADKINNNKYRGRIGPDKDSEKNAVECDKCEVFFYVKPKYRPELIQKKLKKLDKKVQEGTPDEKEKALNKLNKLYKESMPDKEVDQDYEQLVEDNTNRSYKHGSLGSGSAHNDLIKMIQKAHKEKNENKSGLSLYKKYLGKWANNKLKPWRDSKGENVKMKTSLYGGENNLSPELGGNASVKE